MQDNLVQVLSFLNITIMNAPRLTIPLVKTQTDPDGALVLKESLPFLEKQAAEFLKFINQ
jgi:hypothetical protein